MNTDEIDQRRALCIAVLAVRACVIDLCIFCGYLYYVLKRCKVYSCNPDRISDVTAFFYGWNMSSRRTEQ